jgi:hypothetical protein
MRVTAPAIAGVFAAALAATLGMGTAQAAPAQYQLELRTCNVEDAGTDARVEVRLNGNISSAWINLDNPGDDRERGRTDVYNFTLSGLGPIGSLDIAFDNKGDSSHWCMEEAVLRGPDGVTVHPFHNWLRSRYTQANPLRLGSA